MEGEWEMSLSDETYLTVMKLCFCREACCLPACNSAGEKASLSW